MVLTLHLNVLYGLARHNSSFCITVVESVYCAVRTGALNKTD